jgi:hypothetical protein
MCKVFTFLFLIFLFSTISTSTLKNDHLLRNENSSSKESTTISTTIPVNEWIQFKNKVSGKCFRFMGPSNQLVQSECFSWQESAWKIMKTKESKDDNYVINSMMGDYYLENYPNNHSNGNGIYAMEKVAQLGQEWKFKPIEGTVYFQIISEDSNKCINVDGMLNNQPVSLWECNLSDSQAFETVFYQFPKRNNAVITDRWVNIIHSATGKCMKFHGVNKKLELDKCHNGDEYGWNLSFYSVDGSYFITSRIGNYLLDNYSNLSANGNNIFSSERNGGIQQHWYLKNIENTDKFYLISKGTNKCIDILPNSHEQYPSQFDCQSNNVNQAFSFKLQEEYTVPDMIPLNSWSLIKIKGNDYCVKFRGRNLKLVQEPCGKEDEFLWNISWNSFDNTYFIVSKMGNYLIDNYANLQNDGNGIFSWDRHGGIQQSITINQISENFFNLSTKGSKKCISVGDNVHGSYLVFSDCTESNYQAFSFIPVQKNISNLEIKIPSSRWVQLVNKKTGKCMRFEGNKSQVTNVDCFTSQEYQWNLSWNSLDDSYSISSGVNDTNQGYLLANSVNNKFNGYGIYVSQRQGKLDQLWSIKQNEDQSLSFLSKLTGKCIQPYGEKSMVTSSYVQWDCNSSDELQEMSLRPIHYPLKPFEGIPMDEWVKIKNKETGKCMKYSSVNSGVSISSCGDGDEFYFNISWNSWDGTYFITSKKNPYMLLDNNANRKYNGNGIFTWTRHGGVQQQWFLKEYEQKGFFRIISKGSTKCVVTKQTSLKESQNIQQYDCITNLDDQAWKVEAKNNQEKYN